MTPKKETTLDISSLTWDDIDRVLRHFNLDNKGRFVQVTNGQQFVFCIAIESGSGWNLLYIGKGSIDAAAVAVENALNDHECNWREVTKVFNVKIDFNDPVDMDEKVEELRAKYGRRIAYNVLPEWLPFRNDWRVAKDIDYIMLSGKKKIKAACKEAAGREKFPGKLSIDFAFRGGVAKICKENLI